MEDSPNLTPLDRAATVPNSENSPNLPVNHGLDPDDESKTTSLCGEPWASPSSIGGDSVICINCVRIAEEKGLVK